MIRLIELIADPIDAQSGSQTVRIVFDSVYNMPSCFEGIITQTGLNEDVKIYPERPRSEAIEFNYLPSVLNAPQNPFWREFFRGLAILLEKSRGFYKMRLLY